MWVDAGKVEKGGHEVQLEYITYSPPETAAAGFRLTWPDGSWLEVSTSSYEVARRMLEDSGVSDTSSRITAAESTEAHREFIRLYEWATEKPKGKEN